MKFATSQSMKQSITPLGGVRVLQNEASQPSRRTMSHSLSQGRLQVFPTPLRVITWIVVATQLWPPFSNQLFAAVDSVQAKRAAAATPVDGKPAVAIPSLVAVNRTVPKVEPPVATAKFSITPAD